MSKYFWYLDESVGRKENNKMNEVVSKTKHFEGVHRAIADVRVVSYSVRLAATHARDGITVDNYECLVKFIDNLRDNIRILQVAADSLQVKVNEKTREQHKRGRSTELIAIVGVNYGHYHKRSYHPTVEEKERIKALIGGSYLGKWGM